LPQKNTKGGKQKTGGQSENTAKFNPDISRKKPSLISGPRFLRTLRLFPGFPVS